MARYVVHTGRNSSMCYDCFQQSDVARKTQIISQPQEKQANLTNEYMKHPGCAGILTVPRQ